MKRFQHIGVFLTGASPDEVAIAFAERIAQSASPQRVLFARVRGGLERDLADDEDVTSEALADSIRARLSPTVLPVAQVRVLESGGLREILRTARDESLDLAIMGRLLPPQQMAVGSAFTRLARKAPCTVLIVPNYCRPHFSRLLVPVDFSEHSRLALETALDLARCARPPDGRPQVLVQTVCAVTYGYQKLGMTLQQAADELVRVTKQKLDRFVAGLDTHGVEFETVCNCAEDTAGSIHGMATARKMDVIVVGSRGASTAISAILGGTAEEVLVRAATPVLIVKRKGETTSILNALFGEG